MDTPAWGWTRLLSPWHLTGPIFGKELRVSSRRRRTYLLRAAYVVLLSAFVVIVWLTVLGDAVPIFGGHLMARAGRTIAEAILWFQFAGLQLLAVVLMSPSISDEVRGRTLGVLMSTPISGVQIVLGKLFSRLLQLVLLLAVSVPMLGIVRVLGGVSWETVLGGTCVTFTATLFLGSMALYFSVGSRRAWAAMLKVFVLAAALYLATAAAAADPAARRAMTLINPALAMAGVVAGAASSPGAALWPVHCLVMLAAAGMLLLPCALRVRAAALEDAGRARGAACQRRPDKPARSVWHRPMSGPSRLRDVRGSPIAWNEARRSLVNWTPAKLSALLTVLFVGAAVFIAWGFSRDDRGGIAPWMTLSVLLGGLATLTASASSVAHEKEAQSWPILLTIPLDDRDVVTGKVWGSVRRSLLAWCPLIACAALAMLAGALPIRSTASLALVVAGTVALMAGVGVFCSVICRTTTAAVLVTLGVFALVSAVPFGLVAVLLLVRAYASGVAVALQLPAVQFARALWAQGWGSSAIGEVVRSALTALAELCVSYLFISAAARQLRRGTFG